MKITVNIRTTVEVMMSTTAADLRKFYRMLAKGADTDTPDEEILRGAYRGAIRDYLGELDLEPVAVPPSEAEEPDKQEPAAKMTLAQAREFAKATSFDGDPRVGLARYRNVAYWLDRELARMGMAWDSEVYDRVKEVRKAERKLEAQVVDPPEELLATLEWRDSISGGLIADSRRPETGPYRVSRCRWGGRWVWRAYLGDAEISSGSPTQCMAACEALESNPEAMPFGTAQKEDVCPKT